ncbi:vWA domain-containing protein [Chondromyces crocatus]|uniref:Keratin associated protein 5-1 n=1 Tax=Chondromyces crocatus TaxID=52 RepID=A0A0K1EI58_CHOCO|nr:hypothetical protein [Chondromyces crocatus]AKT40268.1 keratin associated protein 5-1 [Chondromyces crocatus]
MAAVSVGGILLGSACSDGDDPLRPPSPSGGNTTTTTGGNNGCTDGAERDCSITIAEHNGVVTCQHGTQTCVGGTWSTCGGGEMRIIRAPKPSEETHEDDGLPRPKSLSMPGICVDNPCDPSCQVFEEDPGPGGITIGSNLPPFPWFTGDINGLDPAIADLGTTEPCSTTEDCQFDQFCEEASPLACAHHPCGTGNLGNTAGSPAVGLFEECSPCVQKVCAQHPECCLTTYQGTCGHDLCLAGPPLKAGCDTCAGNVCATRPGCCEYTCNTTAQCVSLFGAGSECNPVLHTCSCAPGNSCGNPTLGYTCNSSQVCVSNWNATCVTRVTAACSPKTCAVPKWTQACVDAAQSICGLDCDAAPGTCVHSPCYSGDRLTNNCTTGFGSMCAAGSPHAYCCSSYWDDECVRQYQIESGTQCPPKGRCVAYLPDQTNPSCSGVDLTVSVPCDGTVPVCNRGNTAVPAGWTLQVNSYPPNTGSIPSSDPGSILAACSGPTGTPACSLTLTQDLAPGSCIAVPGCDSLPVGSELRVNPNNTIPECFCGNNWSVYQNDACTSPGCIANANVSFIKKLTMFVAVDVSTSMICTGSGCPNPTQWTNNVCPNGTALSTVKGQRWDPLRNALGSFFQDPTSAGINVALRFWPDNDPAICNPSSCAALGSINGCAQPRLFGTLTEQSGAGDPHETALLQALTNQRPCGDTPVRNALDGAVYWATQRKIAHPEEEVIVIFISDGIATHCDPNEWTTMAQIAQTGFHGSGVRTYPIGFGEAQEAFVVQVAQQGGGRGFFFNTTGSTLETSLKSALKSIRGDVQPCDVQVPVALQNNNDPTVTIDDLEIIYTSGGGTDTTLTRVPNAASCVANGWYIDNPANPMFARLCPTTCGTVQSDLGARVQARLTGGCVASFEETVYRQTYQADCPSGSKVQWGFLRWDTTTPSNTSVVFSAKTADTAAGIASATSHVLGTAHANPVNTQVCTMLGPSPECPVNLYTRLGELPDARKDILELTMTMNPSSDLLSAPTIHNWEVTYSCPYSE